MNASRLRRQDHGRPVLDLGAQLIGHRCDDGEATHRLLGWRAPRLPRAGPGPWCCGRL